MTFWTSFSIAFGAIMIQLLVMPWLPVLGIVIPIGFFLIGYILRKSDPYGVIVALLIGGFIVDIWSAPQAASYLFGYFMDAIAAWVIVNLKPFKNLGHQLVAPIALVTTFELSVALWANTGVSDWVGHFILMVTITGLFGAALQQGVKIARRVI